MDDTRPTDAGGGGITRFLRAIVPWLWRWPRATVAGAFVLLAFTVFDVIPPFFYQALYDHAIPDRDLALLGWLFAALIICVLLQCGAAALRAVIFGRLAADVAAALREAMLARVQATDPAHPRVQRRAEVIACFGAEVDAVEAAVLIELPRLLLGILATVLGFAVLFAVEWRLAALTLIGAPLSGAGAWLFGDRAQRAQSARATDDAAVRRALDDAIRGQRTIRAFDLGRHFAARFAARLAPARARAARAGTLVVALQGATLMGMLVLAVLVLVVATALIFADLMTIGALIGFLAVLYIALGGIGLASEAMPALMRADEAMRRIDELLTLPPLRTDGAAAPPLREAIRLEGITFAHAPGRPVLRGLDLDIPRGHTVAFVGPSGAGKSTALGVLQGQLRPDGGRVTWDGHDVTTLAPASLRARMAVVFQDTDLFAMSVRDNIRLGRLDATDEEITAAARAAELAEVIEAMPDGYDTLLGEGNSGLSGGQRQRLAIARALLRDPEVLLLDEATSALDPVTEAALNETLARVTRDRTVVNVTHRLESARRADLIYVLRDGVVAERGTHDALIAAGGLYAELDRRQQSVRIEHGEPRVEPALFADIPLLAALPPAVHAELVDAFVAERRHPGEVVILAGDAGDRFYVVVRGELTVEAPTPTGPRLIGTLRDADVFGEVALLVDAPRTATVTARRETLLLSLARDRFLALLDAHPAARAQVTAEAEARLAALRAVSTTGLG